MVFTPLIVCWFTVSIVERFGFFVNTFYKLFFALCIVFCGGGLCVSVAVVVGFCLHAVLNRVLFLAVFVGFVFGGFSGACRVSRFKMAFLFLEQVFMLSAFVFVLVCFSFCVCRFVACWFL